MATLRFLPQATLDAWAEQGKVDPRLDRVVELQTRNEYPVREAVHFVKVESGQDTQNLLRKVKTLEQIRSLGAEHYMTSVILGETVYEVVQGWLAEEPSRAAAPQAVAPPAVAQSAAAKKSDGSGSEADLLAKLLLDKLS